MQFRTENNAASVVCTATAFGLAGCAIAAGAYLAGVETPVLKFIIAAYLFITVPLFFASLLSGVRHSRHRSFRGTPPAYMEGRRVKRRLRLLKGVDTLLFLTTLLGTYLGQIWAMTRFGYSMDRGFLLSFLFLFCPLAAAFLMSTLFWSLCVRGGWVTPEEARARRDRSKDAWWPESWLEPVGEKPAK